MSEILAALDDPERIHDPRESLRKWLNLQLKVAFQQRGWITDPLGMVEHIFADLGYPRTVAPFVRYMPLRAGDEAGEPALMQRWADFLEREQQALVHPVG